MDWNTTASIINAVAAIFALSAVVYAARQLRFNAWLKAQEIFTADAFVDARTNVFGHFNDGNDPWPQLRGKDGMLVCRKMDELARLQGFVSEERMLKSWGNPIAKAWLLLEPTLVEERNIIEWDDKC